MEGLGGLFAVVLGVLLAGGGIALVVSQLRAPRRGGRGGTPLPQAAPVRPPVDWRAAVRRLQARLWERRPAATPRPAAPPPAAGPPPIPGASRAAGGESRLQDLRANRLAEEAVPAGAGGAPPAQAPVTYAPPPVAAPASALTAAVPVPGGEVVPDDQRLPASVPRRGARPPRQTYVWRAAVARRGAVPSRTVLGTLLGIVATVVLVGVVLGLVLRGRESTVRAEPGTTILAVADFGEGPGYTGTSLGRTTAQSIRMGVADGLGAADNARMPVVAASLVKDSAGAAQELNHQQAGGLLWGTLPGGATGDISATLAWRVVPSAAPWIRYGPAGRLLVPPEVALPGQPLVGVKSLTPALIALQYYQAGDYDHARVLAESLPADAQPGTQNLGAFIRANALIAAGRPADALSLYHSLAARGWAIPAVFNNWAVAATTQGDFATARTLLARAIAVAPAGDHAGLARIYTNLGIAASDAGDPGAGQAALDAALVQAPQDAEANWQRSALAYRTGDGATATARIAQALSADAQNPAFPRQAGLVALMERRPAQAVTYFQQALDTYNSWDARLRQDEGAAVTRNDLSASTRTSAWLHNVNVERGTSEYYIGLAYADQARNTPPEGFLQSTWRHLTGGQSEADRAIAAFQEAVRLDQDREDVRYQLGLLYRHEGDRPAARDAFAQAKKLQAAAPGSYEQLAQMDVEDKKPDQAVGEYQALIAANPGYTPAYAALAALYVQSNNNAAAQQANQQLIGVPARTPRDHFLHAQALATLNRTAEAAAEARAAYTADPSLWEAHLLLAQLYMAAHQDTPALAEYQAVLTQQKDNVEALYESGVLLAAQGHVDEATAQWKHVEQVQPDHPEVHFALGGLYLQKATLARQAGKPNDAAPWVEGAIQEYTAAAAKGPHQAYAHYHLGQLSEQKGVWKDAETHYRQATQQAPDLVEAWQGLVRVLLRQPGRDEDALKAAQEFQKHAPGDERAALLLGEVFLYREDPSAARLQYQQALKLQPGDPQALIGMGAAYRQGGDDADAAQYYNAALRAQPGDTGALTGLGDLYFDQGNYAQAQDAYNRALEGDPNYAPAWTGLGRTLDRLQQGPEAINKLQRAAELDPAAAEPLFYQGEIYSERATWDQAIQQYKAASTLRPSWAQPQFRLGQVDMTLKKLPEAVAAYQQATKLDGNMLEAWFGLGQAERDLGQRKEAIVAYQQALKLKSDYAAAWLYLGYTLEENGQRTDAVNAFQNAVKSANDDATIRAAAQEALSRYQ